MSFTYNTTATNGATSSTDPTITVPSVSDGDLVVAVVHLNNTGASCTPDADSGGTWNTMLATQDGAATNSYGIFWKIANSTEPASYDFTASGHSRWSVNLYVATPSGGTVSEDVSPSFNPDSSLTATQTTCPTDDITVADDSIALAVVFRDASSAFEEFTSVDNGYTSAANNNGEQNQYGAYKLFTTGGATGVTTLTFDVSEEWQSAHFSFTTSGGGGGGSVFRGLTLLGVGS